MPDPAVLPEDPASSPPPMCQSVSQMDDCNGAFYCDLDTGHPGPHEATVTIQWEGDDPVPP